MSSSVRSQTCSNIKLVSDTSPAAPLMVSTLSLFSSSSRSEESEPAAVEQRWSSEEDWACSRSDSSDSVLRLKLNI